MSEKDSNDANISFQDNSGNDDTDSDFEELEKKKQNGTEKTDLSTVLEAADRFGLSNMATAHLINAASTSCGVVSKNDQNNVMYRKKVERMRKDLREERLKEVEGREPLAIGFDERRDKSKVCN